MDETDPDKIIRTLEENYDRLNILKGRAIISIETPELSHTANAIVVLDRPDSLYIRLEAAFGIDVGWLFSDRSFFTIYIPRENVYYTGTADSFRFNRFLSFDMGYNKLMQIFAGMELTANLKDRLVSTNGKQIILTGQADSLAHKYWIDPNRGVVVRTEVRDADRRLILLEEFDRFFEIKGIKIPKTIRIVRPHLKEALALFYNRIEVNTKISQNDYKLKISPNARKIEL